jgi:UDP-N-acetyl-2-amino-2-deoxyglucuronate dehydrogenase
MKNFALTGAAGYIAPRHFKAIHETGNRLLAAVDPHDSVGILDKYFPDTSFFTEFERFDRHLEKLRRGPKENHINYLTICSPNNLHDAHIRLALRIGANALCEKPLVLNPWNLDALEELENEYKGSRVFTVLQLRVHPSLIALKEKIERNKNSKRYNITLTYITSRGIWYDHSWKSVIEKSGGIATNIGVHFFDMLSWIFGDVQNSYVNLSENKKMSGFLELKNADVAWFLSTDRADLPKQATDEGKPTFRSIEVNGEEVQFSEGFTDLHTKVYEETLAGRGFGIDDARRSIRLVYDIRNSKVTNNVDNDMLHPFLRREIY